MVFRRLSATRGHYPPHVVLLLYTTPNRFANGYESRFPSWIFDRFRSPDFTRSSCARFVVAAAGMWATRQRCPSPASCPSAAFANIPSRETVIGERWPSAW
jgi:hypothetical protein